MPFDFFRAPQGPDAGQAMHDAYTATLAKGEAAQVGLKALGAYFQERGRMQEERRQFDMQYALKQALAQQEQQRFNEQEQGRWDRANLRAQTADEDRAAREQATAQKAAQESRRSAQMQASLAGAPAETDALAPADILGLANYAQRMGEQQRKQREAAALNQADTEIGQALSFGIGAGELVQSEKVRGADLYPEFKNAQGPELQAAANEMFPTNPEAAKAWLKSMTSPTELRYLDPSGFSELKQHVAGQLPPTIPGERVDAVAKRLLMSEGYRYGRDEAVDVARKALEQGHNAMLKRVQPQSSTGAESAARAQESHDMQMQREDPRGLLRDAAKGKPRAVDKLDPQDWQWAWEQAQSEAITKKNVEFVQALQAAQADPKMLLHFKQEAAKNWLISKKAVDPNDPAFGKQAGGAQAPAQGPADDQPITLDQAIEMIRAARAKPGG